MAAITRVGPASRMPYGSFAGKEAAGGGAQTIRVLVYEPERVCRYETERSERYETEQFARIQE